MISRCEAVSKLWQGEVPKSQRLADACRCANRAVFVVDGHRVCHVHRKAMKKSKVRFVSKDA